MSEPAPTPRAEVFRYERPELGDRSKRIVRFARTDTMFAMVQVVGEGGENNLHSHAKLDGFWFVLGGQATFYTTDDEVIGVLDRHHGILIPRGYPYWFESTGTDVLELLQVEASPSGLGDLSGDRIDHEPMKRATAQVIEDRIAAAKSAEA